MTIATTSDKYKRLRDISVPRFGGYEKYHRLRVRRRANRSGMQFRVEVDALAGARDDLDSSRE
jgi:hypothetical protein